MAIGWLLWTLARLMAGAHPIQTGKRRINQPKISKRTNVRIRRDWNDHRIGTVQWSDLVNPRWDIVSGGTQTRTPQPFIHAYVWCNKVRGEIAHSCAHGPGPHNIKVCLVKKDNTKEVWNYLLKIVGAKPPRRYFADR